MIITKTNVYEEFGNILKKRIEDKKISRSALGKAVGVHRTTISDYILGKYLPKEEVFHRIHQVFPDKELYDAYFKAVRTQEPRPNKNLIPNAEAYNFYKAEEEPVVNGDPIKDLTSKKSVTLNDKYIMYSLRHTLSYMAKEGLDELCPTDFAIYESMYKEMCGKLKNS